jgi:hypothetical protein
MSLIFAWLFDFLASVVPFPDGKIKTIARTAHWRIATISTDAKFQRSPVGDVSAIWTNPFADEGTDVDCTQNVSPTCVSTRWCTIT